MTEALKKDILQWDADSWMPALNFWEKTIQWSNIHAACEIGARQGGLSLWLAQKKTQTLCSDLCDAKNTASPLHNKYGVSSWIQYEDINATSIPYENTFDIIVFKSILGGIGKNNHFDQQQLVISQIYKALKPGGKLLFAENLAASLMHQKLRRLFVPWGSRWRYLPLSEMHDLLQIFDNYTLHTTGFLAALGRTEFQRSYLAKADKALFNKLCPQYWHYIAYGVAEKAI